MRPIAGKEERERCDLQEPSQYSKLRRSCSRSSISGLEKMKMMDAIEHANLTRIPEVGRP